MGDFEDLDEISRCTDKYATKRPSSKRIMAGKKWGQRSWDKAHMRPKWQQQLKGLRGAATRKSHD